MKKKIIGLVTKLSSAKTISVELITKIYNKKLLKIIKKTKILKANNILKNCFIGNIVLLEQTRPFSKTKNWSILKILK